MCLKESKFLDNLRIESGTSFAETRPLTFLAIDIYLLHFQQKDYEFNSLSYKNDKV